MADYSLLHVPFGSRPNLEAGLIAIGVVVVVGVALATAAQAIRATKWETWRIAPYLRFAYASFLKPHRGQVDGGQQSALESFYSAQVY